MTRMESGGSSGYSTRGEEAMVVVDVQPKQTRSWRLSIRNSFSNLKEKGYETFISKRRL